MSSRAPLAAPAEKRVGISLVDCDVHTILPPDQLRSRLPHEWQQYLDRYGLRSAKPNTFFATRPRNLACRYDAWPPSGGPPGSDPDFVRAQLLDAWDIDIAILNPIEAIDFSAQFPEFSAALSTALNDWIRDEWLDRDPRFRGSITVPLEAPELAAEEIRRRAGDHRFVHVLAVSRTHEPLGHRKYWPVLAAAEEAGRPLNIHVGGLGNNAVTGAGWPSYYYEDHLGVGNALHNQLISLVCQGAFERFPGLKLVLEEGGFGWVAPLMWTLDNAWTLLRDEVPHLERPPSEYVREHVWFTSQPIEEPDGPDDLMAVLEMLDMDDHIMFSTDYPHWDFDAPSSALPRGLSRERRAKLLSGNACDLYGFGA